MKHGLIILIVVAFVAFAIVFTFWAHGTPSPIGHVYDPGQSATSTATSTPTAVSTSTPRIAPQSPFKSTMTTYFYAGEPADAANAFIRNDQSYWDEQWEAHFGGIDTPESRCGYYPCGFTPKENPFYFALPYAEFDANGDLKASAKTIPWFASTPTANVDKGLLLKNHWIEIKHGTHTCFAQWEDVGPNNEDDFAYVFGSSPTPTNTFGEKAGLDISPATLACLGMTDNDITSWRFVDASSVPAGPWKAIVTSSGSTWAN